MTRTTDERLDAVLEQLAAEVNEANQALARIEAVLGNFVQQAKDRAVNVDARLKRLEEERANGPAE